jgi:hypothetical protein
MRVRCAVSRPMPHRFARIFFVRTGPLSSINMAAITWSSSEAVIRRESIGLATRPSPLISVEATFIAAIRRVARVSSSTNLMASLDRAHLDATATQRASLIGSQGCRGVLGRGFSSSEMSCPSRVLPPPHHPNWLRSCSSARLGLED